ncbi:unnamed protein product [Phaeothamnion confervicola]
MAGYDSLESDAPSNCHRRQWVPCHSPVFLNFKAIWLLRRSSLNVRVALPDWRLVFAPLKAARLRCPLPLPFRTDSTRKPAGRGSKAGRKEEQGEGQEPRESGRPARAPRSGRQRPAGKAGQKGRPEGRRGRGRCCRRTDRHCRRSRRCRRGKPGGEPGHDPEAVTHGTADEAGRMGQRDRHVARTKERVAWWLLDRGRPVVAALPPSFFLREEAAVEGIVALFTTVQTKKLPRRAEASTVPWRFLRPCVVPLVSDATVSRLQ